MKFMKGVMLGVAITAGAYMMMNDKGMGEKRLMRKGRKMMKKCGMM